MEHNTDEIVVLAAEGEMVKSEMNDVKVKKTRKPKQQKDVEATQQPDNVKHDICKPVSKKNAKQNAKQDMKQDAKQSEVGYPHQSSDDELKIFIKKISKTKMVEMAEKLDIEKCNKLKKEDLLDAIIEKTIAIKLEEMSSVQ